MTQSDRKMKMKSVHHLKKKTIHPQQSTIKKTVFDMYQKSMTTDNQYPFDNEREAPKSVRELLDFDIILFDNSILGLKGDYMSRIEFDCEI